MQSYVHGVSTEPLIGSTIGAYFDQMVSRYADREALVSRHQNIRWTYRELQRRVDNCAVALRRLGLAPGDRVGLWSQNCAEWAVTQLATAKLGLIQVNINPAYRITELEYSLNKVACKALILSPRFRGSDYLAMLRELAPELDTARPGALAAARLPALRTVIRLGSEATAGMYSFTALEQPASAAELDALERLGATLQFDDPINIQFTSGTTGSPKGVTLTHHSILNNAYFTGQRLRFSEHDRLCLPLPLYHCFGMVCGNLLCMTYGAAVIYPGEAYDPKQVLGTLAAERCTAIHSVPTMFIGLLEAPEFSNTDLSSLRTGICGGAPCPEALMQRLIAEMHLHEITIAFGMTELSPASFQTTTDDTVARRVATVGRVHPHVEAKIVDTNGRIVPRGTPGEMLNRGYLVMRGYWNDPERTREAIDDAGWMHTGDQCVMDDEGYVTVVGRLKDIVIRGGENISPREVEEFLFRHPQIEQVAVFGVPDPKFGEELCVWIKPRVGQTLCAEEIHAHCRGQIAHFKIPRHVRFVTEFPMTVTGKIQKFVMRERMLQELGNSRS